ncbi:hypothetical protein K7H20_14010 [Salipiger manganoxidans]|uniref:hypothetical protein n=1 Tax=Salipiger marinus TaxID=555512 RepID=UPI001E2CC614|nr:hypothetical protein [Salipiger manganoxidans]MCD1619181.1 hypothetical protein [Salipiger manganoxidans]
MTAARDHQPAPFVRAARTQTMLRDFDRLRLAIRDHDTEATEAAWDQCERWVACINPNARAGEE